MANEKLKAWMKESAVSDLDLMRVIKCESVYRFSNRLAGRTEFSDLEKSAIADFAGKDVDELF